MKLTGKCKEEFYNWYKENAHISKFNKTRNVTIVHFIAQSETCQNALIIEWLDSVGIYIELLYFVDGNYFVATVYHNDGYNHIGDFNIRTEATNVAIIKANTIYNET